MKAKTVFIRKGRQPKGFTLLEMVLVIVILGIAVFPLSGLLRRNLETNVEAEKINRAAFFAQQKAEEILRHYRATRNIQIDPDEFEETWEGMTCRLTVVSDTLNNIPFSDVTVTVEGLDIPPISVNVWLVE